jgi:hypothetical protein
MELEPMQHQLAQQNIDPVLRKTHLILFTAFKRNESSSAPIPGKDDFPYVFMLKKPA